MHDGSLKNLEEVINHYNSGGAAHQSKSIHVKPLNLNPQQKTDLINFLKTLTDEEFINNKEFKP
jgi:cytochrome c peroxidase